MATTPGSALKVPDRLIPACAARMRPASMTSMDAAAPWPRAAGALTVMGGSKGTAACVDSGATITSVQVSATRRNGVGTRMIVTTAAMASLTSDNTKLSRYGIHRHHHATP